MTYKQLYLSVKNRLKDLTAKDLGVITDSSGKKIDLSLTNLKQTYQNLLDYIKLKDNEVPKL